MFSSESWQELYAYTRKNKLRTFLTSMGVACGIYILLTLLGVGQGFTNMARGSIGDAATNSVVFWCEKTTKPYVGFPSNRYFQFTTDDITLLKNRIPEIEYVSPQVRRGAGGDDYNTIYKKNKGSFTVEGATADYFNVNIVEMEYGRLFNKNDMDKKLKVALIGNRVKEVLFPNGEDPTGKYILVNGTPLLVVGNYRPVTNNFGNISNKIIIPFNTFQTMYNGGNRFWSMIVCGRSGTDSKVLEKKVVNLMKKQHDIHPDDHQAINKVNVADLFEMISAFFITVQIFLWLIGIGTLITGIIGVSNIMLVIVKERTKEFGIKRALGATPFQVGSQVIFESVVLTFFAGFAGFILAVLTVEGVNMMVANAGPDAEIPLKDPYISFGVGMIALLILVVFGCIAGYLPAKRAISVKPIDALRSE